MVLAAIAEVGTAMSIVGAVTGSKDLAKFGAVLGLVGGIGSLANSALSGTSAGLGQVVDATGGLETATNYAGASSLGTAIDATGGIETATNYADPNAFADASFGADAASTLQGQAGQDLPGPTDDYGNLLSDNVQPRSFNPVPGSSDGGLVNSVAQQPTAPGVDLGGPTAPTSGGPAPVNTGGPTPGQEFDTEVRSSLNTNNGARNLDNTVRTAADDTLGRINSKINFGEYFNQISKFANENKGLMQIGGYALQGMQKASYQDKQLALQNKQLGLVSHGSEVPTYNYQRPGLINSARVGG